MLRVVGHGIARVVGAGSGALAAARRTAQAAEVLVAAGAPLVAPLGTPTLVGDVVVSLWVDTPDDGPRGTSFYEALGRALRRLHAVGAGLVTRAAVDLPDWDPAVALERRLAAGGAAAAVLAPALRSRLRELLPLPVALTTVLHTDAHAGNACVDGDGRVTLVDLDGLAVGPACYDLAAVEVTERRQGGGRAPFAAALTGYGGPLRVDEDAFRRVCGVRELLAVAYAAASGPAGAAEARRRLDGFHVRSTERWSRLG